MDIKIPFTEAEKEELQELARALGVSVETMVGTLVREEVAERLRTSPKIGIRAQVVDFSGPK